MKKTEPCPVCKKPFHWRRELFLRTGGYEKVGRPRSVNYNFIYELRDKGYSYGKIISELKCGRGAVRHAILLRRKK